METLVIIIGIVLIIIGYVSCVLPPLPGPPVAFLSLLALYFFSDKGVDISSTLLIILGVLCILATILDNLVAVWGTHKFGGTKAGIRGSVIGMILGIFVLTPIVGPFSVFVGTFAGAFAGEIISGEDFQTALKSGFGSFIGFLLGLGLKLIITTYIAFHFFKTIF